MEFIFKLKETYKHQGKDKNKYHYHKVQADSYEEAKKLMQEKIDKKKSIECFIWSNEDTYLLKLWFKDIKTFSLVTDNGAKHYRNFYGTV